jgi:nitroreductase
MKNFMDIVRGRRSIRRYLKQEIPEKDLDTILEAIRWSPSWVNTQCWEIIVIKDQAIKKMLQDTLPQENPAKKSIVEAPVVIALCGKTGTSGYYKNLAATKFGDWFMYDLGIATQNICLTAHSLKLGTVIVGLFDHCKAKEILQIPEIYEVVTLIPVGYPAKVSRAPDRREAGRFTHYDKFHSKPDSEQSKD